MRRKKTFLLVGILSVTAVVAVAGNAIWKYGGRELPDAKQELLKLYSNYLKADSFANISGTIKAYDIENSSSLKEETSFELLRSAQGTYSRMHYLQNFTIGKLAIQVDTINQFISVSEIDPATDLVSQAFPFESMLSDTASFRIILEVTDVKGQRILHIQNEMVPEIRICRLIYDPETYIIKSAEIEWWKEGFRGENTAIENCWLTRIDYEYGSTKVINIEEKVNRILFISDSSVQLKPSYKTYKLYSMVGN